MPNGRFISTLRATLGRGRDPMSCQELVEVITDYLEGTMPARERRRMDAHLKACPYCVNYVEQMRTTIVAVGGLREESIPATQREELLEAFRGWRAAG